MSKEEDKTVLHSPLNVSSAARVIYARSHELYRYILFVSNSLQMISEYYCPSRYTFHPLGLSSNHQLYYMGYYMSPHNMQTVIKLVQTVIELVQTVIEWVQTVIEWVQTVIEWVQLRILVKKVLYNIFLVDLVEQLFLMTSDISFCISLIIN